MADSGSDDESFAESHRSKDYPLFFSMGEGTREKRKSEGESVIRLMSTESNRSKDYPLFFNTAEGTKEKKKSKGGSVTTDLSAESYRSKDYPLFFSPPDAPLETNGHTMSSSGQNLDTLEVFESKVMDFVKKALKIHKTVLSAKHKGLLEEDKQEDVVDGALKSDDDETNEAALKIALHILRNMNQDEDANTLEQSHYGSLTIFQRKQRSSMKKKYECLLEVMHTQQWPVPLKKSYTKLCLIEGGTGEVNNEHEVRQIESAFNRQRTSETVISCEDIFKPLPKQEKTIRVVLTKGIAGIGKTVLAQKFMLDWSEEKASQDIQLLFSLPFRELNLLRNQSCSLMELLYDFSPDLKESGIRDLNLYKVLFVLDGLDECRLQLDFRGNEKCYDTSQMASVDALLTNLIAGNLLPKASLWITTRPAAASCIPAQYVDRVTEIRGFNNLQKEQYFHKRIEDEDLAKRVIASIKSTRSLYIMCHVPVFCWISSIVLGKMCAKTSGGKMPKTLTQMYIHFLTHQTNQMCAKYAREQLDSQEQNRVIMSLGKLAFQQLEKGNLVFYEDDLRDCGIDVKEASVYSGVCTQVFREESWLQQKVFCFVHLSVQEFLAALYVHVMHKASGVNLMTNKPEQTSRTESVSELHKSAVDRALQSMNGHLDLFLRFLLGLSLESSHVLLRALKIELEPSDSQSLQETIEYINTKLNTSLPPEKYINLFHCLNELHQHSMVKEIQYYLDSDRDELVMDGSSPARWAALVFVLLTSPEKPEEIQLKKYSRTAEGLSRLLPAIKASRSAMLNDCNLTAEACQILSSTLSSSCNELKHLNLSDNNLEDSGIKRLCRGLLNQQCRLKTLRLNRCGLTQRCCENLALVLSCSSSHLQEMDLSDNDIEDSGVQFLCTGLGNVSCKLEILRLSFCNITERGCGFLASAVKSNPSHLRELDLSYNHLGETGKVLISHALEEGHCEFTKLRIDHSAEHWLKSGLREYNCELTLNHSTAHKLLVFSDDNQKVSWAEEEQPYPDHHERFDYWAQVLFEQGLTGRCYWEMEWEGNWAGIGVTYMGIGRKGPSNDCVIGYNKLSWSLHCSVHGYRAYHDYKSTVLQVPLAGSHRLAVYLDWKCGILSFYRVSSERSLTHLHTFCNKFNEPLYPVFRVWGKGSSLKLCQVNSSESSEE